MGIPQFYTRQELADKLKVDVRTIDRWKKEGKINGKKIKGVVRFSEKEVHKLLDES